EAPSESAQALSGPLPSPPVSLSSSLLSSVSASDFDDAVDEPSSAVMPESFLSASASDPSAALVALPESAPPDPPASSASAFPAFAVSVGLGCPRAGDASMVPLIGSATRASAAPMAAILRLNWCEAGTAFLRGGDFGPIGSRGHDVQAHRSHPNVSTRCVKAWGASPWLARISDRGGRTSSDRPEQWSRHPARALPRRR